ncbi:hypothetical protein HBI56_058720 [Parastagonospora nodorum]|nr:hypothetical protein HBH53_121990 [Parastagonospora nodorum]KAH4002699.1 hypothetical protein HBI10_071560 [Parastagonospora nodorum]KAH4018133.1 hypothetical protein HBI13_139580 [Parastagonospora nodorum]KAH4024583.1 hypothetical protein HBI09_155920 [Parastagonospora nodorum]KAH4064744.1 hypothetical protein HBH50_174940 [Parastagonospora nodorum]
MMSTDWWNYFSTLPWGRYFSRIYRQDCNSPTRLPVIDGISISPLDDGQSRQGGVAPAPQCDTLFDELLQPDFRPHWRLPPYTIVDGIPQISASCAPRLPSVTVPPAHTYAFSQSQSLISPRPPLWMQPASETTVREPVEYDEYTSFQPGHARSSRQTNLGPSQSHESNTSTTPRPNVTLRPIRRTHRPENSTSVDPPPPYQPRDPIQTCRVVRRRNRPVVEVLQGVGQATATRVGQRAVESLGDVQGAMRDVQYHNRVMRAKRKIVWLEKHGFMNAQERLLTREITGGHVGE